MDTLYGGATVLNPQHASSLMVITMRPLLHDTSKSDHEPDRLPPAR